MIDVDFGRRSEDYAKYRPGFPESFYERVEAFIPLTGTRAVATGDAIAATGNLRVAVLNANGTVVAQVDVDLTGIGATTVGALATTIDTALGADGTASVVNGKRFISATDAAQGIAINSTNPLVSAPTQGLPHDCGLKDSFTWPCRPDCAACALPGAPRAEPGLQAVSLATQPTRAVYIGKSIYLRFKGH